MAATAMCVLHFLLPYDMEMSSFVANLNSDKHLSLLGLSRSLPSNITRHLLPLVFNRMLWTAKF